MRDAVCRFSKNSRGATAIEYGVIAAGIALVIAAGVALMGENVDGVLESLSQRLNPVDTNSDLVDPAPPPASGGTVVVPQ